MPTSYDLPLVALSILIAIGASYVALDLTGRTAAARGRTRQIWMGLGALAMGVGIWSMHYIGMLAFRLPVPVLYDISTVVLSFVAAVLAAFMALWVVSAPTMGWGRATVGSVVMGAGIAAMHYVGVAAMRLPATPVWDRSIVALSIIVAVAVSAAAIGLAFRLRGETREVAPSKGIAAVVMGLAICAMHYTGMGAAHWTPDAAAGHAAHATQAVAITSVGLVGIVTMTFVVLAFAVVISVVDRVLSAKSRALRESEMRYRLLFQRSLTGHYRSTRDGRLLECNQAFARIVGYATPEEAIQHAIRSAYGAVGTRQEFLALLDASGRLADSEVRLQRPDGTPVWVLENATLLRGELDGMDVIEGNIIDITARVEADAALARAMAASDEANRAKSEFLANMSHEIRTPMNGILGMAEIVLRTELSAEQRESIDVVRLSAESLMDIINDILDFSKLEAGKLELDPVEFDLRTLVEDAVRTLAPRAHLKALELVADIAQGLPSRVLGDPGRIRQVLLNLLGNALKFTERGEVVLRAEAESIANGVAQLHFSVRDTGIGIPAEKQATIFDAFTQADASTTRRYGGTGLGLTITTHLVGLMQGRVSLESEPGAGSTFHVRVALPVVRAESADVAPTGLADLAGLPVLVVDDNATNRRILERTLALWGLRVTLVDGGRSAIEALERASTEGRPFGIVLLDFQMPEMDGFSVAEAIQRHPGLAGTTIMMLSSVGEQVDGARCRATGVTSYLTKPVRQAVLLDAILALGAKARARLVGARTPSVSTTPLPPSRVRAGVARAAVSLRVLLAEDNPVNQMVARKMLEARGHVVTVAEDGIEVLELTAREPFDVVLMDVQMPRMDGRSATRVIREREAGTGRRLPVIAVTASAMEGDRDECLEAGMDGYVSKPIRYESFHEEVERLTVVAAALATGGV